MYSWGKGCVVKCLGGINNKINKTFKEKIAD